MEENEKWFAQYIWGEKPQEPSRLNRKPKRKINSSGKSVVQAAAAGPAPPSLREPRPSATVLSNNTVEKFCILQLRMRADELFKRVPLRCSTRRRPPGASMPASACDEYFCRRSMMIRESANSL